MDGNASAYTGAPSRPPRLTPGPSFLAVKKGTHHCRKCKAQVLVAQLRDKATSTVRWRNFEPKPVEMGAHRLYRRHFCPPR